MEILKNYRNSQKNPNDQLHNTEDGESTEKSEIMKTVQRVIDEITRNYELSRARNNGEQSTSLPSTNDNADEPQVRSELKKVEHSQIDNNVNSDEITPTIKDHLMNITNVDNERNVDCSENGQNFEIATNPGHDPVNPSYSQRVETDDSSSEEITNSEEEGEEPIAKRRKTRKHIERFHEHDIPIVDFPHPKDATDELVEKLRLQYDLPPFDKFKDMGPGTIFKTEEESEMKIFLSDCCVLGIPRTSDEFKEDLNFYYHIKNKGKDQKKKYVFGK